MRKIHWVVLGIALVTGVALYKLVVSLSPALPACGLICGDDRTASINDSAMFGQHSHFAEHEDISQSGLYLSAWDNGTGKFCGWSTYDLTSRYTMYRYWYASTVTCEQNSVDFIVDTRDSRPWPKTVKSHKQQPDNDYRVVWYDHNFYPEGGVSDAEQAFARAAAR